MTNIITSRKGFLVRGGVRQRRETFWMQVGFVSTVLASSATAVITNFLTASALAIRPFTIVRTRLQWMCLSDQSAATESFVGNIGMAVVSDQAIGVGVSAVPTPATDLGSDLFFLIDQWIGEFSLIGTSAFGSIQSREIDSKAMRKVDDDQDLVVAVEAGIGANGVIVRAVGRVLIKLH